MLSGRENRFKLKTLKILLKRQTKVTVGDVNNIDVLACFKENGVDWGNDNIRKTRLGTRKSKKNVSFAMDVRPSESFRVALTRCDIQPSAWVDRIKQTKSSEKHSTQDRENLESNVYIDKLGQSKRVLKDIRLTKTRNLLAVRVARCRLGLVLKSREFVLFSVESDCHSRQTKMLTSRQTENSDVQTENSVVQTENSNFQTENSDVQTENSNIQTENSNIQTENSNVHTENSNVQTENSNFPSNGWLEGESGENSQRQDDRPNLPDIIYKVHVDEMKLEALKGQVSLQTGEAESGLRQTPPPSITSTQLPDINGPLQCFLCECKFVVSRKLRSHSGGEINRKWFCSQCKCLIKRVGRQQNLALVRRKRSYPCLICKSDFSQPSYMWTHTARCHGLPLECAKCAEYFISVADCANHSKTSCGSYASTKNNANTTSNRPKCRKRCKKPTNYKCAICKNKYRTRVSFVNHIREHANWMTYRCTLCSCAFLTRVSLKCHMRLVHSQARYRCSQCSRKFRTRLQLLRHLHIRHSVAKLRCRCSTVLQPVSALLKRGKFARKNGYCAKCSLCKGTNLRRTTFKRCATIPSNRNEEGANFIEPPSANVAQFRCSLCSEEFTYKWELKQHSRIHKRRRGPKCALCECHFPNKIVLRQHMASHLEIETFQCAKCDRAFSQSSKLETHLKIEHPDSQAKCSSDIDGFVCENCGLTFGQKKKLMKHLAKYGTEFLSKTVISDSSIKLETLEQNCATADGGEFSRADCQ